LAWADHQRLRFAGNQLLADINREMTGNAVLSREMAGNAVLSPTSAAHGGNRICPAHGIEFFRGLGEADIEKEARGKPVDGVID
jgi:hypothetical protein